VERTRSERYRGPPFLARDFLARLADVVVVWKVQRQPTVGAQPHVADLAWDYRSSGGGASGESARLTSLCEPAPSVSRVSTLAVLTDVLTYQDR
jgi:hypothetical protein